MSGAAPLRLFAGFGVEIEYMIVDAETLDVRPLADALLAAEVGAPEQEIERGDVAWSNELARHVIELKTNGPAPRLRGLAERFQAEVRHANALLRPLGARLLPTAMHPWMDPHREFELWPHGDREVYAAFDRIFDCRGHGWANLQSAHLNLPFADDAEFGRLHAAVRAVLPLVPALAASSPLCEGKRTGLLDTRLQVYRGNAARVPEVTGAVVPEPVFSRAQYEAEILEPLYRAMAPLDPAGTLRHEWLNARGCIARFDRNTIEVRVTDVQECPAADLAVAAAVAGAVRWLVEERGSRALREADTGALAGLLERTLRCGADAAVEAEIAALFGAPARTAGALWRALLEGPLAADPDVAASSDAWSVLVEEGPLARRILRRLGDDASKEGLRALYAELADCLEKGSLLRAAPARGGARGGAGRP